MARIGIVDESLSQVDVVRGNVTGFFNAAVTSSSNLLTSLQTDLQKAVQQTDGFNQQQEETLLTSNEELVSNSTASLAIMSQQRSGIVALIRQIAGLTAYSPY